MFVFVTSWRKYFRSTRCHPDHAWGRDLIADLYKVRLSILSIPYFPTTFNFPEYINQTPK